MPKKREPPKPLAKALTLFNQLLGFFSSSITLKSYAVHSAIRVFKSIQYEFSFIILQRYTFFIENKAWKHCFVRILSKFHLKSHLCDTKSSNNWSFLSTFATHSGRSLLCTTYWNNEALCSTCEWKCEKLLLDARTVITVRAYSVDWLLHLHLRALLTASIRRRGISTTLPYN